MESLFKTAVSLEETGKIQIVALDKTGTITSGEPKVTDILPAAEVYGRRTSDNSVCIWKRKVNILWQKPFWSWQKRADLPNEELTDFQAVPGNGLPEGSTEKQAGRRQSVFYQQ